jgi:hypothetical protein
MLIGRPVRLAETPRETARQQMVARGWPPAAVEEILHAQAAMVTKPRPITSTVEVVTGAPAHTFCAWVTDHADGFRAA